MGADLTTWLLIHASRAAIVDALAACSSVPLALALGWLFSDRLDRVRRDLARAADFAIRTVGGVHAMASQE